MAIEGQRIKDVSLVSTVNGTDKMPVSQGGSSAKTISVDQIKTYTADNAATLAGTASNLTSWAERGDNPTNDTWNEVVRTTAGDLSINTNGGGKVVSIVPNGSFGATSLKATGFNLLRNKVAVGEGYYILVPACEFGTYGTADKNNGILFTDNQGHNLNDLSVYFKPYASGVPTTITDGTACGYTDSNNKRFYTPSGIGYLIISGGSVALTSICCHIAWSRRYDEYIAQDAAGDAGGSISLSSIIAACHDFNLLLSATRGINTIADKIVFGASAATWYRNVGRVQATWTDTQNEDETYTHTATISGMKNDGIVECGNIQFNVDGNVISYTDTTATGTTEFVKYELASAASGNVTISPSYVLEDWGLEYFEGVSGSAYITTQYSQGYPDMIASLPSKIEEEDDVIASALNSLNERISGIENLITNGFGKLIVQELHVNRSFIACLVDVGGSDNAFILVRTIAPAIVPSFIGQIYVDTTGGNIYIAKGVSSVADFVKVN